SWCCPASARSATPSRGCARPAGTGPSPSTSGPAGHSWASAWGCNCSSTAASRTASSRAWTWWPATWCGWPTPPAGRCRTWAGTSCASAAPGRSCATSPTAATSTSSTPTSACRVTPPASSPPRPTTPTRSPRCSGATTCSPRSSTPRKASTSGCGCSATSRSCDPLDGAPVGTIRPVERSSLAVGRTASQNSEDYPNRERPSPLWYPAMPSDRTADDGLPATEVTPPGSPRAAAPNNPTEQSPPPRGAPPTHVGPSAAGGGGRARPAVPGYEILGELGRGGMGVVYLARQVGLDRVVALKMLGPGAAADGAALARFRTEAEAVARLRHPNIVPVYEIATGAAGPYFAMEFAQGRRLPIRSAGLP